MSRARPAGERFPAQSGARAPLLLLALLAALLGLPPAVAGEPGGPTVDYFRGPVVTSSRVTGLGGACTGLAEGTQGAGRNAASLANRYPYSTDAFDWDLSLDWLAIVPGADVDMDNDGHAAGDEEYRAITAGLSFLFSNFGIGVWLTSDTFVLADDEERVEYGLVYGYLGAAYAFLEQQLLVGPGLSSASLDVRGWVNETPGAAEATWQTRGEASWSSPGAQVGLLWRPRNLPIRVGTDLRLPIRIAVGEEEEVPETLAEEALPAHVHVPWRLACGIAWFHSFGGRTFNRRWDSPQAAPEGPPVPAMLDRRYLLATLDLVATGPAPAGAVGPGSYINGQPRESGADASFSVHAGVESEVWNDRLVLRGGSYLEPARLEGAAPRLHGTFGAEVRLFRLWRWQLRAGLSTDVASGYLNWGIGLGFWH